MSSKHRVFLTKVKHYVKLVKLASAHAVMNALFNQKEKNNPEI